MCSSCFCGSVVRALIRLTSVVSDLGSIPDGSIFSFLFYSLIESKEVKLYFNRRNLFEVISIFETVDI